MWSSLFPLSISVHTFLRERERESIRRTYTSKQRDTHRAQTDERMRVGNLCRTGDHDDSERSVFFMLSREEYARGSIVIEDKGGRGEKKKKRNKVEGEREASGQTARIREGKENRERECWLGYVIDTMEYSDQHPSHIGELEK